MEKPNARPFASGPEPSYSSRWPWVLTISTLLVVLLALLLPRPRTSPIPLDSSNAAKQTAVAHEPGTGRSHLSRGFSGATLTPEQIVAGKVTQFAEDRLRIAHAMAERFKVSVPPDVEKFFQAVAAGRWEELNVAFKALRQRRESGNGEDLGVLWGPILETQLIAECAHDWPAQKLLDYGNATLGALRPGMVYVGGTDPGRGIPTLLNETNDGERRIVITQNGLADESYLQYLDFLYGDRVATLTSEDSQRAFQDYMADAQKRLAHDHQYSSEAEQAYRLAMQISPASPEAVYGLGQLLATTGRADEARQLVANFERARPSKDPAPVWALIYSAAAAGQAPHP